jgi:flagellar hook-associated protein 2
MAQKHAFLPVSFVLILFFLLPAVRAAGQSGDSSGVSMPGVNSRFNTEKLIEETMKAERIPLERMKDEKESYAEKKRVWNQVSQKLSELAKRSEKLYGFQNPFKEFVAESSSSSLLTATANRNAEEGIHKVKVEQVASKDVFLSDSLPEDHQVPAGDYRFGLGDEEVTVSFDGGDLGDFVEEINNRAKELVSARTVRDTSDTRVLVLEGGKTGAQNTLSFSGAAEELAVDIGMLKRTRASGRSLAPSKENVRPWKGDSSGIEVSKGVLRVAPRSSARLRISPGMQISGNLKLNVEVRVEDLPKEETEAPSPPPGPSIPAAGGVELEGIRIENSGTQVELPEQEKPEPPKRVDTLEVLAANGSRQLPALKDTTGTQTLTLTADQLPQTVSSIDIDNANTDRAVYLSGIELVDPDARGDYAPANPVSTASDSRLKVDGVTITRSTNQIEDVIPGVTLQPQRAGEETAEVSINPDKEAIKNAIINFAGSYNQVLTDIHILTSNKESVIEEITYFDEKERQNAREKLGLFQGEATFMQLRNRLQRIITAPYDTSAGNQLAMLSQIGISSNASGFGGTVTRSRLRGYMEVNEQQLDKALDQHLPAIKQLFGRDDDGDLVVDSGLAYRMNQYVREYTKTGGIISTRIAGIDRKIDDTEEDMADMEDQLARKRQSLKRKYGRMESTIGRMEKNSSAIDRLNSGGGQ